MLKIQINTRNNAKTIERTIQSLLSIPDSTIFISDNNSTDKTLDFAKKYNKDTNADWTLLIHPWEALSGHELILEAIKVPNSYKLFISQNDFLKKEIRLWHKNSTSVKFLDCVIYAEGEETNRNSPYEECIYYLNKGENDKFIQNAERFLFFSKIIGEKEIMIKYYLAWVYCIIKSDSTKSLENLLIPLSMKPLMAEFWCLLADIHYFLGKDFEKANTFYEIAKIMGTKRDVTDNLPVQLSKYSSYPNEMINNCKNILKIIK